MKYEDLIELMARHTGRPKYAIKQILNALPDVLSQLEPGERVVTPLGQFRMFVTSRSKANMPQYEEVLEVPKKLIVKLRPGRRLKREPDEKPPALNDEWEQTAFPKW